MYKRKQQLISPIKKKKRSKTAYGHDNAANPRGIGAQAKVEHTEYEDDNVVKDSVTIHTATPGPSKTTAEELVVGLQSSQYPNSDVAPPESVEQSEPSARSKTKKKVSILFWSTTLIACLCIIYKRAPPKDPLKSFEDIMEDLQSAVIGLEYNEGVGTTCSCKVGSRSVRCIDCIPMEVSCLNCATQRHIRNPLHRLEIWNGFYFSKLSPQDFIFTLELGHDGKACSSRLEDSQLTTTTTSIIHTNGIHKIKLGYCSCNGADPHWKQLVKAGLFPGTVDRPETAFTVSFMKFAHLLSTIGHISAMDLVTVIRRVTNGAFLEDTPVSKK